MAASGSCLRRHAEKSRGFMGRLVQGVARGARSEKQLYERITNHAGGDDKGRKGCGGRGFHLGFSFRSG